MTDQPPRIDSELDASGLRCPLPMLRAKLQLNRMQAGEVLRVVSTDPGSRRDFEAMVKHSTHELLNVREEGGRQEFLIRRG